MTYANTRDDEQLRLLDTSINDFAVRYSGSNVPSEQRRTLILLTGGMGSRLVQATMPYQEGAGSGQTFDYDTAWLDIWTLLGNALMLKMHPGPANEDRDHQDRIVLADGPAEFLGCTPYDRFTDWCEENGIDWFVYGWDWRRPLDEAASFFLTRFLPRLRSTVQQTANADPLASYVLVGHSAGGMVLGLALRDNDAILSNMTHAITVAAPFYGYGGQIHRWFYGEPFLNGLGVVDVIKTISSFSGCYALHYMDRGTFMANRGAFAADAPYALNAYPSKRPTTPFADVDSYNPAANQYPSGTGFSMQFLGAGLGTYQELAAGPLPQHAGKFYNIRGISDTDTTVGGITWGSLSGYTPGGGVRPVKDSIMNQPGDGTQPAWSTRLLTLPKDHWIDVKGGIDHMFMMEYAETQAAIGSLLGVAMADKALRAARERPPLVEPASTTEALAFVRQLQSLRGKMGFEDRVLETLRSTPEGKLRSIARRIMMDIMKSPTTAERQRQPKKRAAEKAAPKKPSAAARSRAGRTPRKEPARGRQGGKKR